MTKLLKLSIVLATAAVLVLMFTACDDGSSGSGGNGSPPSNDSPPDDSPPVVYDSTVTVSVSIRDDGATISVPDTLKDSYTLYASQEENCDVENYQSCTAGEMHSLSAATPTAEVTALTTATTAYFTLRNENSGVSRSFTVAVVSITPFSPRYGHQVVVFEDKLWLIGGFDNSSSRLNDVWSSDDGAIWSEVNTAIPVFDPRWYHRVVDFKDKLWLIGGTTGYTSGDYFNDVWSSADGENWNQVTAAVNFDPRIAHQVVDFKEKLWLISGYTDSGNKRDVWSSADGENWNQVTGTAAFGFRVGHQVVVFDNKLWLIGGNAGGISDRMNDVWSSADGAIWNRVTAAANFSPRYHHQVVVFDNKLWLIGGSDDSYFNDVWSSTDGENWNQVTATANFEPRSSHQVVVFDNKLWLIGGSAGSTINDYPNDVWHSVDGDTWKNALHERSISLSFE